MNSTNTASHSRDPSTECEVVIFLGGRLDHTAIEACAVLVFITALNVITFPITAVLNALVTFAVPIKPRLKTSQMLYLVV